MYRPLTFVAVVVCAVMAAACSRDEPQESAAPETPVTATIATGGDPTANEISNYELTLDKMRRWMTASRSLALAARNNPAIADAPDAGNASIADMIAWYDRTPAARDALRSAGITSRDYAMTTAAYIQAAMTEAMLGMSKDAKAPEGQNMRNVEFVRQNRTELERMAREMGMDQLSDDS